jgi:hypothetical protein
MQIKLPFSFNKSVLLKPYHWHPKNIAQDKRKPEESSKGKCLKQNIYHG